MQTIVNELVFSINDKEAIEHFNQHGWVVLEKAIPEFVLENVKSQWLEMKSKYADEMNVSLHDYQSEVSQWRDLWLQGGSFEQMIHGTNLIHERVMEIMGWDGVRLLHDHIVAKPSGGSNKKIPWHQDSMFWPVDLPGCSSWVSLGDVSTNDGCLEVVDFSHLEGCMRPVDFMAHERDDFPEESIRVQLPIKAGSMILLHSLTWHRSSPNLGSGHRPAHLGLWIHPDCRWRPDLVDWHPVNAHVETRPNTRLEGKRFPMFGSLVEKSAPNDDIHEGTMRESSISMFDASKTIANQISSIIGKEGDISDLLSSSVNREIIRDKTTANGINSDDKVIEDSLQRLWISYTAYKLHRARNIYNDAYSNWWEVAGKKWHDIISRRA